MSAPNSIQEALNQALNEQGFKKDEDGGIKEKSNEKDPRQSAPITREVEKPKEREESAEEEEQDKDKEEPLEEESDKNDLEVMQALQLSRLLKDPAQARAFGETLVRAFEDKTTQAPAQTPIESGKELIEKLEKIVGDDNTHLLEPVIAVFTELAQRREKVILTEIQRINDERATERMEAATTIFIKDNDVTPEEMNAMAELTLEMPQSTKVPLGKYMGNLLKIVRSNTEVGGKPRSNGEPKKTPPKPNTEKIKQNLQSKKNEEMVERQVEIIKKPKNFVMTPKVAAQMAARNQQFEED